MVQFNDRSTGKLVDLGANIPKKDAHHHVDVLGNIAYQYRVASSLGDKAPKTVLDHLDTARNAALSSVVAHSAGNMISAQANMHSAAAYSKIAAESLGISNGANPEVQQSQNLANSSADSNDNYMRETGGTDYSVGRFN
jgi:hypothetical protein